MISKRYGVFTFQMELVAALLQTCLRFPREVPCEVCAERKFTVKDRKWEGWITGFIVVFTSATNEMRLCTSRTFRS